MAAALHPSRNTRATPPRSQERVRRHSSLGRAAVYPLDDIGWLRVTGSDRVRWLNGRVTNAIQSLAPGEGCYNFELNAQGRIQGDCIYAFRRREDSILLETAAVADREGSRSPRPLHHHGRRRARRHQPFAPRSPRRRPASLGRSWRRSGSTRWRTRTSACNCHAFPHTRNAARAHTDRRALAPRPAHRTLVGLVYHCRARLGNRPAPATEPHPSAAESLEVLRILEGTPRYGVDIRNTDKAHDLPQETGQDRALNFAKGCYLGQEIVERIRSRGSVHRTFSGFTLTGALPAPGAELTTESAPRPVGELTSVAAIPLPGSAAPAQLALGYIRREALERGLLLHYPGGTATPAALPFAVS